MRQPCRHPGLEALITVITAAPDLLIASVRPNENPQLKLQFCTLQRHLAQQDSAVSQL
jgi:hypothetical protein